MRRVLIILLLSIYAVNSHAVNPLYNTIGLQGVMSYDLFEKGMKGYDKIDKKRTIITFIDFTKPSVEKRLYVIDLEKKKLLYNTYVSHGRNSGGNYATQFSNQLGSNKSSLGFFLTTGTYQGKNGYSLRLSGLEQGINDRAEARAIVIHGASYSNPNTIAANGRLGRSLGCPALPMALSREIIDVIKNGSVLFIYAEDSDYLNRSTMIGGVL